MYTVCPHTREVVLEPRWVTLFSYIFFFFLLARNSAPTYLRQFSWSCSFVLFFVGGSAVVLVSCFLHFGVEVCADADGDNGCSFMEFLNWSWRALIPVSVQPTLLFGRSVWGLLAHLWWWWHPPPWAALSTGQSVNEQSALHPFGPHGLCFVCSLLWQADVKLFFYQHFLACFQILQQSFFSFGLPNCGIFLCSHSILRKSVDVPNWDLCLTPFFFLLLLWKAPLVQRTARVHGRFASHLFHRTRECHIFNVIILSMLPFGSSLTFQYLHATQLWWHEVPIVADTVSGLVALQNTKEQVQSFLFLHSSGLNCKDEGLQKVVLVARLYSLMTVSTLVSLVT